MSNVIEYDQFVAEEFIDKSATLPTAIVLNDQQHCGYFIPVSTMAKCGWINFDESQLVSHTFRSGEMEQGVLIQNPRMLVCPKTDLYQYDVEASVQQQTRVIVGLYNAALKDERHIKTERLYLVFFRLCRKNRSVIGWERLNFELRFPMSTSSLFKWRHFLPDIIVLNVRWYCRYALSYRNLEEIMQERGVEVDHSTLNRWVLKYAPQLNKRVRSHLRLTNDSWRVDETYIKVKGQWKYLYRAVDSQGNTLDFLLCAKRDAAAAERFLRKTLKAAHTSSRRVINVDKNAAYPPAIEDLKSEEELPKTTQLRQVKYLNNTVEQDHRFIKRLTKPGLGFGSFNTARQTIRGFEAMNMLRKGQVQGVEKGDIRAQVELVSQLFGIAQ